jgi:hypothetical protein
LRATGVVLPACVLVFCAGCSSDATSPEASAALALAFHERMQSQIGVPDEGGVSGWTTWEAELFTVGFEGVDDQVEMPDSLRNVIEAYWAGNAVVEIPAEATLAEQGRLLAPLHEETAASFEHYFTALEAMADEDDDETAARGLLAMATVLHKGATRSIPFQYPRLELLNHVVLSDQYAVPGPRCALFDPSVGDEGSLSECSVSSRLRWDLEVDVLREVLTWLDEIEAADAESPWRTTVLEAMIDENIRVKPSSTLALPVSTAAVEPEVALNVVITTDSIQMDGELVLDFPEVLPGGRGNLRDSWSLLEQAFADKASDARKLAVRNASLRADTWLLQADVSVPMSLIHDVMTAAASEGFHRPQIVVMPATSNPVLLQAHARVVPVSFASRAGSAQAGGVPDTDSFRVSIGAQGYELRGVHDVSIPCLGGGGLPYAELTREAVRIRAILGSEGTVVVTTEPDVGFQALIASLDALREHRCGEPGGCEALYPDVRLLPPTP